jgi:ACS family tartrate transporter-like MFS transporter
VTTTTSEAAVFSRCAWRLIPFMGLLYVCNFLDRVNVGFAALTMNRDIGLSAQAYGLGAGMFFIGYFFCEVPSNLIMEKVGARLWMFRIMFTWGLVSMATAFARGPVSFYVLRFLLGVCEAGFFPGMILYLTYWFPAASRGQFSALFLSAILVANIIGSPISGYILTVAGGVAGLKSWQWLFLLEAIPSLIFGMVTLFYLPDRPAKARWLSDAEKTLIHDALARDEIVPGTLRDGLSNYRIWLLCLADVGLITATYGLALWLPQIVKAMGFDNLQTGFLVAIPYAVAIVAMIWWARTSDANGERLWHVALPALLASAGLVAAAMVGTGIWAMLALTVATLGIYAAVAVMWTLPQSILGGTAATAAIALVNSVGNLGGFAGPAIAGYLKDATGGYSAAMLVFAAGLAMSAAVTIAMSRFIPDTKPAIVSL